MSFVSGSSSSELKNVPSPTKMHEQELAMLKRNEIQAVAGASNKWRDTAGISQGIIGRYSFGP